MIRSEDEIVYKLTVTFQDILDNAPANVQNYFVGLSREEKDEFVQENSRSAGKGFEFGLCDPVHDVIKTVGQNFELPGK